MLNIKTIPISYVNNGIKECIKNAKILLSSSRILHDNQYYAQSVSMYYYALEEFGKAVLLRDRQKMAEYKKQTEIVVSDFFDDNNKKIKAAIQTAGPNVEIMKNRLSDSERMFQFGVDNILRSDVEHSNLITIDYDPTDKKWGTKLLLPSSDSQKKAFTILEKTLKKWEIILLE